MNINLLNFKLKYFFVILFQYSIFNIQFSFSQNLVYNPSFESDSGAVIKSYSQKKAGSILVDGWMVPTDATSDYYNSHESTIRGHPIPQARTGQGRVALICSNAKEFAYREFICGKLIQPLEKNKKYKVTFYVCRYKYAHHSPMQLGVYFTKERIFKRDYRSNIRIEPQVKVEDYTLLDDRKYWHKVEQVFVADGDEKYITLGNFKQTMNDFTSPSIKVSSKFTIVGTRPYAYIFFDDISVEEYTGESTEKIGKPKLFLFMVDASSSMNRDKKFKKLVSGIQKAIKKLPIDAYYSIVTFSVQPKSILEPSRILLDDLADVLDSVKVGGSTNASQAIDFAYNKMESYKDYAVEVIMCTDGKFTLSEEMMTKVMNQKSAFNLMQIGGGRSKQLDSLVNATNGKYVVTENKRIKEDVIALSSSAADNSGEVLYTKANVGMIALKYLLALSLGALIIVGAGG